jgi:hypothetical protein
MKEKDNIGLIVSGLIENRAHEMNTNFEELRR